jgi:hypothetical protein
MLKLALSLLFLAANVLWNASAFAPSFSLLRYDPHVQSASAAHPFTGTRWIVVARETKRPFDFLWDPKGASSTIPKEMEQEIYAAEANTAAAMDRARRISLYTFAAVVGILGALGNGLLTELRSEPDFNIESSLFAWAPSNGVASFFFMNKLGGGLLLVMGAVAGLLAETESDAKRKNAELIWQEMQKRRQQKQRSGTVAPKKKKRNVDKRMEALTEVYSGSDIDEAENEISSLSSIQIEQPTSATGSDTTVPTPTDTGVFAQLKNFYEKADNMAATQALLLNKELEDKGIVEKITDESGLKVIGKQAAANLKGNKLKGSKRK